MIWWYEGNVHWIESTLIQMLWYSKINRSPSVAILVRQRVIGGNRKDWVVSTRNTVNHIGHTYFHRAWDPFSSLWSRSFRSRSLDRETISWEIIVFEWKRATQTERLACARWEIGSVARNTELCTFDNRSKMARENRLAISSKTLSILCYCCYCRGRDFSNNFSFFLRRRLM